MNIHELLCNYPNRAVSILGDAGAFANAVLFPQAEAIRSGSTGGVLSVWYDSTSSGNWVIGCNLPIGTIGGPIGRSIFDSCELYDHHATVKNTTMLRAILDGRKDNFGRSIIASSQLADETPDDPFAKRYGGGILCCDDRVAISFSGLPWKFDEMMAAAIAYRVGRSITATRVQEVIEVSQNEFLAQHARDYFSFDD